MPPLRPSSMALTALVLGGLGWLQGCSSAAPGNPARVEVVCAVAPTPTTALADPRQQAGVQQQKVTVRDGAAVQSRSYTGVPAWPLLQDCALQAGADAAKGATTAAATPHDRQRAALGRYVLASGADGYMAVFSVGELHPDFGNKGSLVAYGEGEGDASAGTAASLRFTAPGDVQDKRYVAGLARLEVRSSGSVGAGSGTAAPQSVQVLGAVGNTLRLDEAALHALPAVTHEVGGRRYTGVDLWSLLHTSAALEADGDSGANLQAMYLVATGADGYQALVSLAEMSPDLGGKRVLIAYRMDGQPLARGLARLVVVGDGKAGRSVSGLEAIEVFAAAPAVP